MRKPVADRLACVDLRIGANPIDTELTAVLDRLRRFSPDVEPSSGEPGVFWLNAAGLGRIYASPKKWADAVRVSLEEIGFDAVVVVGFTRFGAYALARAKKGSVVLRSPEQEHEEVRKVPLKLLRLPPSALDALAKLKKRSAGDLIDLPAAGLLERFGPEVHRLRAMAASELWSPLLPKPPDEPIWENIDFDQPESNALRLTFFLKGMLRPLLKTAAARHEAVVGLEIELVLDHEGRRVERIRPAAPTLDEVQLADLIRLRLESMDLPAGAVELKVTAETVEATTEQLKLFAEYPQRNLDAANRAFARLRAEFGKDVVVRAVLKEGHLPEACFEFETMDHLSPPSQTDGSSEHKAPRTLVRRIYARPIPLQARPVVGPRGCHLQGMGEAPATRVCGPYIVSGGWWARPVHREYHFAETENGRILWVYFDKKRRMWFIHGEVE